MFKNHRVTLITSVNDVDTWPEENGSRRGIEEADDVTSENKKDQVSTSRDNLLGKFNEPSQFTITKGRKRRKWRELTFFDQVIGDYCEEEKLWISHAGGQILDGRKIELGEHGPINATHL